MPGSLLAGALVGYEPIVGRSGNALAMRVTVQLADRSADMAALYRALSAHVPGGGAIAVRSNAAITRNCCASSRWSLWVGCRPDHRHAFWT